MSQQRRHVVYDGDCSLCRAAIQFLIAVGVTRASDARTFEFYDPDAAARLMRAGIHNELAVFDPLSREVRSGAAGLLWKLEEGPLRWVAKLLGLPGPVHLAALPYRMISYNRRILAPLPAGQAACACDPDPSLLWRGLFIAFCLGSALLLAWPYAESLADGAALPLALVSAAALLAALSAAAETLPSLLNRAGILAWLVFQSSLLLLPFTWLAGRLMQGAQGWTLAAGALACLGCFARLCVRRFSLEDRYTDPAFVGQGLAKKTG